MLHRILNKRASGILLHVTSLPSAFGIGDLGPGAYRFVDFLAEAHQRYWQILPLTQIDPAFGNSPYSSVSAFGANTLLISPELLIKDGWLKESDLKPVPKFSSDKTNYNAAGIYKFHLLDLAFEHFKKFRSHPRTSESLSFPNASVGNPDEDVAGPPTKTFGGDRKGNSNAMEEFARFCLENQLWLEDYTLFVVLKEHFQGKVWSAWPKEFCLRKPTALSKAKEKFSEKVSRVKFFQYVFFKQWSALKSYAQKKGIHLIGDIPIYVNYDGADVWTNPQLFKLDSDLNPICVAGVPPDYFSKTGQRWGNPVYDWQRLKEINYRWWANRIRHNLNLFDYARIDHFRGLIACWEIPLEEETAVHGRWQDVPYENFFTTMLEKFPTLPLIAEDLGMITPDVTAAMNRFGFPGMKVLLFAFGGDPSSNPYMPQNHIKNCVVYTGTHDNNTVRGWFEHDMSEEEKKNLLNAFENSDADNISQLFVSMAMESRANTVIIPMQDILGLGQEARMNIPGTARGNWEWRVASSSINDKVIKQLSKLTKDSGRDTDSEMAEIYSDERLSKKLKRGHREAEDIRERNAY